MLRDFLSKKISNPFLMVCHCAIALDSGWSKFPLIKYLNPMVSLIQNYIVPSRKIYYRKCQCCQDDLSFKN